MLYIGVLRIEKSDSVSALLASLPEKIGERLGKRKNENEKRLGIGAYALLFRLCSQIIGEDSEVPEILYTGEGKPYFSEEKDNESLQNKIKFNISHDGELATVCICDSGEEVGIDVQSESRRKISLERIAERFFSPFRNPKESVKREEIESRDVSLSFYVISDGEIEQVSDESFALSSEASEFLSRWTLLEAALKADSRGFGAVEESDAVLGAVRTHTFSLSVSDREYAVSAAVMKTNLGDKK